MPYKDRDVYLAAQRGYYRSNKQKYKDRARVSTYYKRYGLTEYDYNRMFVEQDGCCFFLWCSSTRLEKET